MVRALWGWGLALGLATLSPPSTFGQSLFAFDPLASEAALAQAAPPSQESPPGGAAIAPAAKADEPEVPTKVIRLRPTVEPKRSLRYALLPEFVDRTPGNAAVGYMRVGLLLPKPQPGQPNADDQIMKWMDLPLKEFPVKEVQEFLDARSSALKMITDSARREYCDWELPVRNEPFMTILLPEVQEARSYGRLVMLQARLAVASGNFEEAIKSLQTGYALARHVSEGPTLINGLVGAAISATVSERLIELIEQPGAPSLYWPLTVLPQPLIDFHRAFEMERNIIYLSYPMLRNIEDQVLSVAEAQALVARVGRDIQMLGGNAPAFSATAAVFALALYPSAKASLIADGVDRDRVEAMPVAQVLLAHTLRKFDESRDALFRTMHLPYVEAIPFVKAAEAELAEDDSLFIPLARLLLPSLTSVQIASHRGQRTIAALRIVEALRLHAGLTGELPNALADVTCVPIPTDPLSGKPFVYRRTGDSAVLEAELPPGVLPQYGFRYELQLTKE
ncbi:MAG TPA: hypothetical protein VGE52_13705 [Pirellulales bacterium]